MRLSIHGFWASLYQFAASLWATFKHRPLYGARVAQTDLCTLIRTIFVWAPLALAINAITLAAAVFSVGFFALMLFQNLTGVGIFLLVICGIALLLVVIFGLIFGTERILQTETAQIVGGYLAAKKSKICPTISFGAM